MGAVVVLVLEKAHMLKYSCHHYYADVFCLSVAKVKDPEKTFTFSNGAGELASFVTYFLVRWVSDSQQWRHSISSFN